MTSAPQPITDPAAADFLTHPETRSLLAPFMARETPMAQAAKELGIRLSTLHRRVKQMTDLGLLELTREEVRDGHRVKLYQTTYREFIVPLSVTTHVNLETFNEKGFQASASVLGRGLARAMERSCPHWGFRVYHEEGYGLVQKAIPLCPDESMRDLADKKTYWYGDTWLQLSDEEARAFRRDLQALYDRYRFNPSGENTRGHFFFAALTPC